ncbi:MAG: CehA/McbA family metallohydrolase, partial [Verrucomicrobiales bacterium]|nr:CehA/McbA family metallohydrolase [Verrucomicrobiales bacterium]
MKRPALILAALFLAGWAGAHEHTRPKTPMEKAGLVAPDPENSREITVRILNTEVEAPLPGCIRIAEVEPTVSKGAQTPWLDLSPLLARCQGLSQEKQRLGWFVLAKGETKIRVPKGKLKFEAFSGIEFSSAKLESDEAEVKLKLMQLFDPERDGWIAGNTHLHLNRLTREECDRYLREIPAADRLRVVFVSYLERAIVDRTYISNEYTAADLEKLDTKSLKFGSGQEYRHNFGGGGEGYGHVMLLEQAKRILPASLGPGITKMGTDGTPLRPGIERARADGGTVIWCHNSFGHEDIPNWLGGRVDAQNIFDGGNRGSYEDTFYRYLNLGIRVPFSTGTDWFIYDFSRVYVRNNPEEKLTKESFLKSLRNGSSIITNGPWITLKIDAAQPGDTLALTKPATLKVDVSANGRFDFEAIEIVKNGEIAHSHAKGPAETKFSVDIEIDKPSWIAARIKP